MASHDGVGPLHCAWCPLRALHYSLIIGVDSIDIATDTRTKLLFVQCRRVIERKISRVAATGRGKGT